MSSAIVEDSTKKHPKHLCQWGIETGFRPVDLFARDVRLRYNTSPGDPELDFVGRSNSWSVTISA